MEIAALIAMAPQIIQLVEAVPTVFKDGQSLLQTLLGAHNSGLATLPADQVSQLQALASAQTKLNTDIASLDAAAQTH